MTGTGPKIPTGATSQQAAALAAAQAQVTAAGGAGYVRPDVLPFTISKQGIVIPLAWGTVKMPVLLVEKFAPSDDGQGTTDQRFLMAICEGQIQAGVKLYWDKTYLSMSADSTHVGVVSKSQLVAGGGGGSAYIYLWSGNDAATQDEGGGINPTIQWDECGYQHTAILGAYGLEQIGSGTQEEIPNYALGLQAVMFSSLVANVNPADIVSDITTHSRRGCGFSSGILDSNVTGSGAASFKTYCNAAGFRISKTVTEETTAIAILAEILIATASDAFWSQGKLHVVPLWDQSITAPVYGATNYVPANTPVYNFGVDDFLDEQEPVQVSRRSDVDCFNSFPVSYFDASQQYAETVVEDPLQDDCEKRGGLRRGQTISIAGIFADGQQPIVLSRVNAQRSCHVRNTFTWKANLKAILVDPTDIVTLTEPSLGLSLYPVRVLTISESADGLTFTAEDYPAGANSANAYVPQTNSGYAPDEEKTIGKLQLDGIKDGSTYKRITAVSAGHQVQAASIASNAVEEAKINTGAVTNAKLGASAVTAAKVASDAIAAVHVDSGDVRGPINRNAYFVQRTRG